MPWYEIGVTKWSTIDVEDDSEFIDAVSERELAEINYYGYTKK